MNVGTKGESSVRRVGSKAPKQQLGLSRVGEELRNPTKENIISTDNRLHLPTYNMILAVWRRGSPAEMYDLSVHHFITGVNGVATEDFDSFTNEIKKLAENNYCQITLVSLQGVTRTVPLMPNWRDFKTIDARRVGKESHSWEFQEL